MLLDPRWEGDGSQHLCRQEVGVRVCRGEGQRQCAVCKLCKGEVTELPKVKSQGFCHRKSVGKCDISGIKGRKETRPFTVIYSCGALDSS